MTQTAPHPSGFPFANAFRGGLSLLVQVMIGMMLVLTAGIVAVMTALAGVMLAAAALVMRFAGGRRMRPSPHPAGDEPVTLEARRTPRGWTVE
ncbi:MAG: hypothetical protein R3C13_13905 [Hyphomonas sp.]|uniref:hypothetical protein n=1 Tax=Hyphomonas sp. TaxID=87 RepID=UPI00352783B0